MDKLAPAIAWIKENKFWLANGLLLLLMAGIWYLVTGNLHKERDDNESKIKREFTTVQSIKQKKPDDVTDPSVRLHPNRITKDGMQAELKETVDSIIAAWKLRVDAQKKLLVFPEVIGTETFSEIFAQYNPAETFPVEYANDRTIYGLLSLYRLKIKEHMINICGKDGVRTNWRWDPANYPQDENDLANGLGLGKGRGSSSFAGGDGDEGLSFEVDNEDASRFAVLWSDVNQKLWYDKLTQFQDRDDHNKESNDPTPLQAYMLQQDLWVLEAMFNVIQELNGDSTATDTSAIKQIDHIGIGREGNVQLGMLHALDSRFGPDVVAGDGSETGEEPQSFGFGSRDGGGSEYELLFTEEEIVENPDEMGRGGLDEPDESDLRFPPFHEMYVDTNFEPISSEEVLKVVKGEELPETNLELLIAKRLPVRIALKMDERKIPDFMAASINSPFSFEIQQVRINRHTPGGELINLGGGGKPTGSPFGGKSDEGASKKFNEVSQVETRVNYDVNVEFFGIIKIYNPVRADLIRKAAGLEPEESTPSDSVDPAESAAIRSDSSAFRTAG